MTALGDGELSWGRGREKGEGGREGGREGGKREGEGSLSKMEVFVLFCFAFVLFCFVLFCFVLFCFVLFCFVLFCFVYFFYFQLTSSLQLVIFFFEVLSDKLLIEDTVSHFGHSESLDHAVERDSNKA